MKEKEDVHKEKDVETSVFYNKEQSCLYWTVLSSYISFSARSCSEFFIQYIDPESHTIRSYYPDFLLQKEDGQYFLIEVKADNQIDAPVVIAKRDYAEKMAAASNMTYFLLKASDAENGRYKMMWSKEGRDTYLATIDQPTIGLLG